MHAIEQLIKLYKLNYVQTCSLCVQSRISSNSSYVCVCVFINLEISLGGVYVHWTLSLIEGDTKEAVLLMNNLHLFICIYHTNEPPMKQKPLTRMS